MTTSIGGAPGQPQTMPWGNFNWASLFAPQNSSVAQPTTSLATAPTTSLAPTPTPAPAPTPTPTSNNSSLAAGFPLGLLSSIFSSLGK